MQTGRLNKYFHSDEFACKCGCGIFNLDSNFFISLTDARRNADVPFVINSGCRCPSHNYKVGGTTRSAHVTTEAIKACGADIKAGTVEVMAAILRGALTAGIPGIALGTNYIHLDTKGRRMIKSYSAFTLTKSGLAIP